MRASRAVIYPIYSLQLGSSALEIAIDVAMRDENPPSIVEAVTVLLEAGARVDPLTIHMVRERVCSRLTAVVKSS